MQSGAYSMVIMVHLKLLWPGLESLDVVQGFETSSRGITACSYDCNLIQKLSFPLQQSGGPVPLRTGDESKRIAFPGTPAKSSSLSEGDVNRLQFFSDFADVYVKQTGPLCGD